HDRRLSARSRGFRMRRGNGGFADRPAEPELATATGEQVRWVWNEGERQVVDAADVDGIAASVDLDPPVERVRMVWAIGLNYRDHAAETGAPIPTEPVVFVKSTGSIVGHG